jgi:PBSX family phage portal protein
MLIKARVMGGDEASERRRGGGRNGGVTPGQSAQLPEAAWQEAYANGEVVEPPYDLDALSALYETNATNKACIDVKAINIVGLGYQFVPAEGADGSEESRRRLEDLFGHCNPEMTFTEILRCVWTDVEAVGNGYLEVTRNSLGEIDGFYHVPATTVRVRADHDGFVQIRDGRTRHFRRLGGALPAGDGAGDDLTEIMHLRKYTPQSSYYGIPDIVAAIPAAAGDKAARDYNFDFFAHNAVPRLAIIVEGGQLTDAALRQVQRYMESEIKGQNHKTLVLEVPGGEARVRIEKLTVGSEDEASFLGYRRSNRDEIATVHRVPPSKISIVENANLANSRDQDKTFREQVVQPEQRRLEHRLNEMIRDQIGIDGWQFRLEESDLESDLEKAEIAKIYTQIGVWTAEEARGRV